VPSGVVLLIAADGTYQFAVEERGGSPVQRLLVIEDEPSIGTVVSRALSAARVQTDGATDDRSGLEMARSSHYDLVLVDLMRSGPERGGQRRADRQGRPADPRGTFTPTVKATSGPIAYQATTTLTVK
jgi:CheY-like chemotaxis protein